MGELSTRRGRRLVARNAARFVVWTYLTMSGSSLGQAAQPSSTAPLRITRDRLCVTNGAVTLGKEGWLAIETPSARAVVRDVSTRAAEIRFRYLGPTAAAKPLASGELRRQIGLKLRAQDTCNLLYVMWHIEPNPRIAVAIKRNPGKHTHAQCGARGYVPLKGEKTRGLPPFVSSETHSLLAELRDDRLSVLADGQLVWEGSLGPLVSEFDGPVGLRTDNGRFEFEMFTPPSARTAGSQQPRPCRPGPGEAGD
jgi:hypothetical protein